MGSDGFTTTTLANRMMPATGTMSAQEIEIELVVERGIDGVGRRDKQQRVAVGRRANHRLGREIGGGTRPAFDHNRLAEPLRKPLAGQSRGDVGRPARADSR